MGSGDPDSAQWSHLSRFCHWRLLFSSNGHPSFKGTTQNQVLVLCSALKWRVAIVAKRRVPIDPWALSGFPEPTIVGFCDVVGVGDNGYPPFKSTTQNQNLFLRKDFYFLTTQAHKNHLLQLGKHGDLSKLDLDKKTAKYATDYFENLLDFRFFA